MKESPVQVVIKKVGRPRKNQPKLVPMGQYKGPVLQLTSEDKSKILQLELLIENFKTQISQLEQKLNNRTLSFAEKGEFQKEIKKALQKINETNQKIRGVKIARHQEQIRCLDTNV